jgi:hypothetical protein
MDLLCADYSWALAKIINFKGQQNDNMQSIVSAPDQPGKFADTDAAVAAFE